MKRLSFIFAMVLGLLGSAFGPLAVAADTVLVFGDSLSAGYGLQAGEEWPALLQQKLEAEKLGHYTVVNTSISGETTTGGLARFKKTFNKYMPAIVILELGANDGLRGQPLKAMRDNLNQMIRHCLAYQAKVVLVSMEIPPNYGKRYTTEFQQSFVQLQKKHGISRTDFLLGGLSGRPELLQKDGLHPVAEAQPILLETVWKSLKPLLQRPK